MVGQRKVISMIDSLHKSRFPRTLIIEGERGSGKKLLVEYIADKLTFPINILEDITYDKIQEIEVNPVPFIYLIKGDKLTIKDQNSLLKLIEEPPVSSFIIILIDNRYKLLPTVQNRSVIIEMDKYTRDELSQFIPMNKHPKYREHILNIFQTPGKIEELEYIDFESMFELCFKIVQKLSQASLVNTLTISDKLIDREVKDNVEIDMFLAILPYAAYQEYVKTNDSMYLRYYHFINEYKKKFLINNLNKDHLIDNFLTELWTETRKIVHHG